MVPPWRGKETNREETAIIKLRRTVIRGPCYMLEDRVQGSSWALGRQSKDRHLFISTLGDARGSKGRRIESPVRTRTEVDRWANCNVLAGVELSTKHPHTLERWSVEERMEFTCLQGGAKGKEVASLQGWSKRGSGDQEEASGEGRRGTDNGFLRGALEEKRYL